MTKIVQLEPGVLAFISAGYRADCDHDTCAEFADRGDLQHSNTCGCPVIRGYTHLTIGDEVGYGTVDADTAINARMTNNDLEQFVNALKDQLERRKHAERFDNRTEGDETHDRRHPDPTQ